ncbi:MAG: hypothetical protein N3G18_02895 [Candidatus Saccharicenans sp.]|nr:hypothetical protein [Candidatus Saccharicenans sp.]
MSFVLGMDLVFRKVRLRSNVPGCSLAGLGPMAIMAAGGSDRKRRRACLLAVGSLTSLGRISLLVMAWYVVTVFCPLSLWRFH